MVHFFHSFKLVTISYLMLFFYKSLNDSADSVGLLLLDPVADPLQQLQGVVSGPGGGVLGRTHGDGGVRSPEDVKGPHPDHPALTRSVQLLGPLKSTSNSLQTLFKLYLKYKQP